MFNKCLHVLYKGRVQGVGFRYTAIDYARGLGLTGWVMNLASGDVELVAEGPEENLQKLLTSIASAMRPHIKKAQVAWSDPRGQFKDFDIRFS